MNFPEQLMKWMDKAHAGEAYLAAQVGCHQGTIRNWLKGRCKPNVEQIPRIADALDVPAQDVLEAVLERDVLTP